MQNKPNSPNVQMNLTNLTTTNYSIFISLTKPKNKPNQSQNKANSNPIKPKTNPIQTQTKPTCSELVESISPTPKFDYLKCLKFKPIMLLSLRVPNKMKQKRYLEERS